MTLYTLRIFKSFGARDAEKRWVNNYELEAPDGSLTALKATADVIVNAEKQLHFELIHFLSYTLSTYVIEPSTILENFITQELSGTGAMALATGHMLDSNVCVLMKYNTAFGRQGRRFYRGCLAEGDVNHGGDGRFQLTAGTGLAAGGTRLSAFRNLLLPHMGAGASTHKLVLAGIPKHHATTVVRFVTDVSVGGIVINKQRHKYFDRGPVG